mmetsp:Transcript_8630/g.27113  ORF Transcript_8630/g.27113 Transcript_8630/m.27113 type:complete len:284 (+) Transcript_8630:824-1675(+)
MGRRRGTAARRRRFARARGVARGVPLGRDTPRGERAHAAPPPPPTARAGLARFPRQRRLLWRPCLALLVDARATRPPRRARAGAFAQPELPPALAGLGPRRAWDGGGRAGGRGRRRARAWLPHCKLWPAAGRPEPVGARPHQPRAARAFAARGGPHTGAVRRVRRALAPVHPPRARCRPRRRCVPRAAARGAAVPRPQGAVACGALSPAAVARAGAAVARHRHAAGREGVAPLLGTPGYGRAGRGPGEGGMAGGATVAGWRCGFSNEAAARGRQRQRQLQRRG